MVALLSSSTPSAGPPAAVDLEAAARTFEEVRAASARDAGALWGVKLDGPVMIADPQTRYVVANRPDAEGRLVPRDGVWVGTLPPDVMVANTYFSWAGVKWTIVTWDGLSPYRQERIRLLMHECFHRVQEGLGLPARDIVNNHLDTMVGRLWLRMEWRALERALRTRGAEQRGAVADALYFRAYRRAAIPGAAESESALEIIEGLGEYTGLKLAAESSAEAAVMAAMRLREAPEMQSFARSFAYISVPAYGLLLDAATPGWRRGIARTPDLGAATSAAYGVRAAAPTEAEALARTARYEGDEIIALERRRDEARLRELAAARSRLVTGPVLVLKPAGHFGYSFDPRTVMALDERSSVYPELKVSDDWGTLVVRGGALVVRDGDDIARVVVPAPAKGATRGDGWELELAPGWKLVPGERAGDLTVGRS